MERVFWKVATGHLVLSDESAVWRGGVSCGAEAGTAPDPDLGGNGCSNEHSGHSVALNDAGNGHEETYG